MSSPGSSLLRQDSCHLPYDDIHSAEMSVLGALLLDQGCTPKVTALITEDDFFLERNRISPVTPDNRRRKGRSTHPGYHPGLQEHLARRS